MRNGVLSLSLVPRRVSRLQPSWWMPASAAFSLMELLAVMAICGILLALSVPAINSTLRASSLTTAGQGIIDQLNLARQTALSRGVPVEVRFYQLPDFNAPPTTTPKVYRGVQSFLRLGSATEPLTKLSLWPQPVVCLDQVDKSSLMSDSIAARVVGTQPIPTYENNYAYRSFYFKANGSLSLADTDLFLTLGLENDRPLADGANYFTIQIDPLTGRARSLRP